MKTHFFVFFFLTLCSIPSFSQKVYFNRYYHFGVPQADERSRSAIETQNGYIVAGYSLSGAYPYVGDKIQLYEVNRKGELLWGKEYMSDTLFNSPSDSRIFQGSDSTYEWFICQSDTSLYRSHPVFVRFDRKGDLLYSKTLYDPFFNDSISYYPGLAIQTNDGGYFLVCNSGNWYVSLFKFDNNLELDWKREIGNANAYSTINNVIQTTDSGYIIGSGYTTVSNDGEGRILRLDKNGNITGYTATGGPLVGGRCFVDVMFDSSYLVATTFPTQTTWWGEPTYGRFKILRYTRNWQLQWTKIIGDEVYHPYLNGLIRIPDSTYILYGYLLESETSYILRINQNGDSLLYRQLRYNDSTGWNHWVGDGQNTSDRGILFAGDITIPDVPNAYPEQHWLVKTDWYGCDSMGCDTTAVYIISNSYERTICKGDQTWFSVVGYGNGLQYRWQVKLNESWLNLEDGYTFSGVSSDTLRIIHSDSLNGNRTFRCKVNNAYWHLYTPEILMVLYESPILIQQPTSVSVQPGDSTAFTINAAGTDESVYQWFFRGAEINFANSRILAISPVMNADTGYYQCRVRNYCGEVWSDTAWLRINENGIQDLVDKHEVTIIPNPVMNQINVFFNNENDVRISYMIYNIDGTLMMDGELLPMNGLIKIHIESLPLGIYLLQVRSGLKVYHLKVIKA